MTGSITDVFISTRATSEDICCAVGPVDPDKPNMDAVNRVVREITRLDNQFWNCLTCVAALSNQEIEPGFKVVDEPNPSRACARLQCQVGKMHLHHGRRTCGLPCLVHDVITVGVENRV